MKVKYQLDAPPVVKLFTVLGVVGCLCSLAVYTINLNKNLAPLVWVYWFTLASGVFYLLTATAMIITSYFTKEKLIKKILPPHLSNYQQVLEIGIGSGMGAIILAHHNADIEIDAIDIFNIVDHQNNSLKLCQNNLKAANVNHKVTVKKADMRTIPFDNHHFDAAFGILSIHNLENKTERKKALTEIIRVIKPGGKIVIIDFKYHNEYRKQLQQLGAKKILTSRPYISVFPFLKVTSAITAELTYCKKNLHQTSQNNKK
jgi:ubiquinone/menaquinone biosynthesis C-methylase UbiE